MRCDSVNAMFPKEVQEQRRQVEGLHRMAQVLIDERVAADTPDREIQA